MPPIAATANEGETGDCAVPSMQRGVQERAIDGGVITICHPVWRLACGGLERQLLQTVAMLPRDRFRHVLVVRGWDDEGTTGGSALEPVQAGTVAQAPERVLHRRDGGATDGAATDGGVTTCLPDRPLGDNVEIVRQTGRKTDWLWSVRLASILRRHSVDVLHVRGVTMLTDSVLAAGLCGGVAVAFSFHGFENVEDRFGEVRRRAYRAAVARCDDCWAVSRAAAEAIAGELRMAPDRFGILPNGVDTRRYVPPADRSEVRRRLGLPNDKTVILSVGSLKPIKGHAVLLQAMQRLGGDAARTALVLVGRDHSDGTLQRRAREYLSDVDIRFVEQQRDTLPWYQAADLFVLPSRWEGMSNALLEAMSCGLPAVATAVGGNVDVIDHGRTGLLVKPDQPEALCAAVRRLMTDTRYRTALAGAGRAHVRDNLAASVAVDRHARRYTRLARRNGAAQARAERTVRTCPNSLSG